MANKTDNMEKENSLIIELLEDLRSIVQCQDSKIQGLRLEVIEQSKLIEKLQKEIQHAKVDLRQDNQDLKVSVLSSLSSPVRSRPWTSPSGKISLDSSGMGGHRFLSLLKVYFDSVCSFYDKMH